MLLFCRLVEKPVKTKGNIYCRLCTPEGSLQVITTTTATAQCNCLGDMELISFPLLRDGCILVPEPLIKKLRPLYFYNF